MTDRDPRPVGDVCPSLTYQAPRVALAWLERVFGLVPRLVVDDDQGGVRHSELSLGNGVVMVSGERPDEGRFGPRSMGGAAVHLSVCVPDVDGHHARAVAEGATIVQALADTPFGARGYMAEDLEGHRWFFSNYTPGPYWTDGAD